MLNSINRFCLFLKGIMAKKSPPPKKGFELGAECVITDKGVIAMLTDLGVRDISHE